MSLQYSHLLIPDRADFVPQPEQVAAFIEGLVRINAAPLEAIFRVAKLSGESWRGRDPLTGNEIFVPRRNFTTVRNLSDVRAQLVGLDDFDVLASGQGPPFLPPFALFTMTGSQESEYSGPYGYELRCHLRAEAVSTSEVPLFGSPCRAEQGTGIFRNPMTGVTIVVQNAGCARFWVEFGFGKWLFPKIGESLNLLPASILTNATDTFGTGFAQGCIYQ
jgi:hypothetical protein